MSTQYTPYETKPPQPDLDPTRSSAAKPLMILLAIIGGIVLLFVIATTIFTSATGLSRGTATLTADATGVQTLEVDASAAQFTLEFAAVDEATLATQGLSADRWELQRRGDTLRVDSPSPWFNWCFFNCNRGENQVTLTLPEQLNDGSLSAEVELNAGQLHADGAFDQLAVELNAGEARVNGTARTLDAQVNAGDANLSIAGVENANFEVAAGRLTTELTGSAPTTTEIEVNAGQLNLTLPDETYAVTSDVTAGSLDNRLTVLPDSQYRIAVELAAGDVRLLTGAQSG